MCVLIVLLLLIFQLGYSVAQSIDGCPSFGCTVSGTFSFHGSVPRANATINWQFSLGPIPDGLGCVGNTRAVVCQSNGPGGPDTGYVSMNMDDGSVRWRTIILRFPSLPVLDTKGKLWGSDGNTIMHYTVEGSLIETIKLLPTMRPLFSMQFLGTGLLLLVSENGHISTMTASDGKLMASMTLTGTVEQSNGTFLPVSNPVVNGNRFYVLREFLPDDGQYSQSLGLQRLYAIDSSDKMNVAWYADFERESYEQVSTSLKFRPKSLKRKLRRRLREDNELQPLLLWEHLSQMVYVGLPPPMMTSPRSRAPKGVNRFVGVMDNGNYSTMVFRSEMNVANMFMYEMNNGQKKSLSHKNEGVEVSNLHAKSTDIVPQSPNAGEIMWVSLTDGKLCAIEKDGNISKTLDLPYILKTNLTITSKITVTRNREYDEDILLFGITVQSPTEQFRDIVASYGIDVINNSSTSYVVALDTPENNLDDKWPLMWMVQTPDNTIVSGQIIGIKGDNAEIKDQIIVFSQIDGQGGTIFSIV